MPVGVAQIAGDRLEEPDSFLRPRLLLAG